MLISKLLILEYLPYAKYTILSRAIPSIDGLKPVQRRILYSMNDLGLGRTDATTMKSVRIVGDVMGKYHPHGDTSIYGAIITMSSGYEAFNNPYIKSKGSFGKVFSRDLRASAPRYTEAKLMPISMEFFDGIKENAVKFVPNFDASEMEPSVLPVRFPSILVNSSDGVAVGISTRIPSFSLTNVCNATIGLIDGTITNAETLAPVLSAPEFTTGGYLHASTESLVKLCRTGKGTFTISGRVQTYSNHIDIDQIPYNTTAEAIIDAIEVAIKENKITGIKDVRDEIGLDGLKLVVELKAGYNARDILRDLCRYTPLRNKISYRTNVIINNRPREIGLYDLLVEWLKFREDCIINTYTFRLDKYTEKEIDLSTWDKIKDDLQTVVNIIANNTEADAKKLLMTNYGLIERQVEYLLELKIRNITKDRALKSLKELEELRAKITDCKNIINNQADRRNLIKSELKEIIAKYGANNKTTLVDEIKEEENETTETVVNDEETTVILTRDGYIKRLTSLNDLAKTYVASNGDTEVKRWKTRNNEYLLVFDKFGTVHKILVDDIDQSRGKLTDRLFEKAGVEKKDDIIYVDVCGDYTGYFNLVYPNGRGTRVYYNSAAGNRKQYKSLYEPVENGAYWITTANKFFMVTKRNKAAYCDITLLGVISSRSAFKVARVSSGDYFTRLVTYDEIPHPDIIDFLKYSKGYTVSIGYDVLWKE